MVSGIFAALFSFAPKTSVQTFFDFKDELDVNREPHDFAPVSYTHLTLPTILRV